ncbi:sperm-associated antigen 7 homolog [Pocillopora verrucosa]|uniref:sperm-associated antigen 7 homolog n=1 Tax=Pocillopora verrucosa TaxID=203993 RepID=UPI003340BFB1
MDLLGSILNSMDAPPSTENKKAKEEKAKLKKHQLEQKKKNAEFRSKTEKQVNEFIKDTKETRLKFPPMTRVERSIVHDVAEIAGLTTFSFGEDEVDRYVMLFKKEFPPSDEELEAYRNGQEFDPESAEKLKEASESNVDGPSQETQCRSSKVSKKAPSTFYKDKYRHLLGTDSGKDAAKATKSNSAYGYVPSENKRDLRSIEETLNDIRKRKKFRPGEADDEEDDVEAEDSG